MTPMSYKKLRGLAIGYEYRLDTDIGVYKVPGGKKGKEGLFVVLQNPFNSLKGR